MNTNIPRRLTWSEYAIDPIKRARSIRDAVKFGKIKPSKIIDETLVLLDQIVENQERQTA